MKVCFLLAALVLGATLAEQPTKRDEAEDRNKQFDAMKANIIMNDQKPEQQMIPQKYVQVPVKRSAPKRRLVRVPLVKNEGEQRVLSKKDVPAGTRVLARRAPKGTPIVYAKRSKNAGQPMKNGAQGNLKGAPAEQKQLKNRELTPSQEEKRHTYVGENGRMDFSNYYTGGWDSALAWYTDLDAYYYADYTYHDFYTYG